jgi:DNA-binding CsgD family transcriptional regulator
MMVRGSNSQRPNIFTKLDVDSRTAAVAYGIKHRIVEVGTL